MTMTGEKSIAFETSAGFPVRTMVHTDKGLVPIDEIKIGDRVLSQPDVTGERSYKPVVKLFQYDDREIVALSYEVESEPDGYYTLHPTGDQLFWVAAEGWKRADSFEGGERLVLVGAQMATVLWCVPVFRTREAGVGWCAYDSLNDHEGVELNFGPGPAFARDGIRRDVEIASSDAPRFRSKVYSFEVADNHTYYIGHPGIWVHNDGCSAGSRSILAIRCG